MTIQQKPMQKVFTALALFILPSLIATTPRARADAPPCRYTFPTADTVKDTGTGLTWQRATEPILRTRADAATYCQGLSLDGTGWRLPTVRELQTIVDIAKAEPAIDTTAFPGTLGAAFWSASPYALNASYAWNVDFGDGGAYGSDISVALHVRCVR